MRFLQAEEDDKKISQEEKQLLSDDELKPYDWRIDITNMFKDDIAD